MAGREKPFDVQLLNNVLDLMRLDRESHERKFQDVIAAIDKLTGAVTEQSLNIAQLSAQQKATANSIDRLIVAIDRQNSAIDGYLAVAQAQSANIAELTKLLTITIANKN